MNCNSITRTFLRIRRIANRTRNYRSFQYSDGRRIIFPQRATSFTTRTSSSITRNPIIRIRSTLPSSTTRISTRNVTLVSIVVSNYNRRIINDHGNVRITNGVRISIFRQRSLKMAATNDATFSTRSQSRKQFTRNSSNFVARMIRNLNRTSDHRNLTFTNQHQHGNHSRSRFPVFILQRTFSNIGEGLYFVFSMRFRIVVNRTSLIYGNHGQFRFHLLYGFSVTRCLYRDDYRSYSLRGGEPLH